MLIIIAALLIVGTLFISNSRKHQAQHRAQTQGLLAYIGTLTPSTKSSTWQG